MHIIDADKLLELVNNGMLHSRLCYETEPVTQNGEYDVVSDIIRRLDLFTYNQLKVVRDYIVENMI